MSSTTTIALPSEVVTFWFGAIVRPLWFAATAEFDQALRECFLATYQAAAAGERADWEITPEGALALVMIGDRLYFATGTGPKGRGRIYSVERAARDRLVLHARLEAPLVRALVPAPTGRA